MIHEEIVTFEVAKLAKERGFPQSAMMYYEWDGFFETLTLRPAVDYLTARYPEPFTAAPTQSLLQRWLREEKGIHIGIGTDGGNDWCYITVVIATGHTEYNTNIFPTYEQALEDAELYVLKNLL